MQKVDDFTVTIRIGAIFCVTLCAAVALGVSDAEVAHLDKHALHSRELIPQGAHSKVPTSKEEDRENDPPKKQVAKGTDHIAELGHE